MSFQVHQGDALAVLQTLPSQSVNCCVTSPPYFGLRDYGIPEQIGLERTWPEYVARLLEVFAEVRRVLRSDGTLWLNLGDSYATGAGTVGECPGGGEQGNRWKGFRGDHPHDAKRNPAGIPLGPMTQANRLPQPELKPKDLMGIPWRVAFALQAAGWYLRSDIIWHKPNPMPESVTDRPTKAHEYLFLVSKSEQYFYDAEAVKEAPSPTSHGNRRIFRGGGAYTGGNSFINSSTKTNAVPGHSSDPVTSRNRRTVWSIATQPFLEAHFATFPEELIEPCILAGCPEGGTVLDPFAGAFTSGLVAEKLGRNSVLIELNPKYVEMGRRRIEEFAPLFLRGCAPEQAEHRATDDQRNWTEEYIDPDSELIV